MICYITSDKVTIIDRCSLMDVISNML